MTTEDESLTVTLPPLQIGVAVALYSQDNVLMLKRKGAHGEGTWSFPGGHVEPNETAYIAAQRELLEETGVHLPVLKFREAGWCESHFMDEGKRYITLYFEAEFDDTRSSPQIKEPAKCSDMGFFKIWNLPTPMFLPVTHRLRQAPKLILEGCSRRAKTLGANRFRSEHDEVELTQLRQYMGDLVGIQVVPREVMLGGRWSR